MSKPVFGCPFHGLVKGGELTLPNAAKVSYPQPAGSELGTSGITQRVRGAGAAVPQRTPAQLAKDTAKGYQWLDYAIVSGENGQLCGQALGEHWHLYTDPSGVTWKMTARLYVSSSQVHIRIYLINAYGRFPKRWEDVNREILGVDYSLPNGETDPSGYLASVAYLRAPERNSDGSVLLFHLYWTEADTLWWDYGDKGFPYDHELRAVYKVTLSGSGNYENQALLGAGIGASAVLYKDLSQIETDLSYDNSQVKELPSRGCTTRHCDTTVTDTIWDDHDIRKRILRVVFDSNDQETEISSRDESHYVSTIARTKTGCGTIDCLVITDFASTRTEKFDIYRDDELIGSGGDLVSETTYHWEEYYLSDWTKVWDRDYHHVITWRGLTLRDSTEEASTLDVLPGDHPDGININPSIAFISPQVIGILVKQATRNGPGNFTLKRVHVGPAVAAEADSAAIDQFDPATGNWKLKVFGSYEPGKKQITRAADSKVCYV